MTSTRTTTLTTVVDSPIGPLTLAAVEGRLTRLSMEDQRHVQPVPAEWERDDVWFKPFTSQLDAYFAGELQQFDVPLSLEGTPFQQRVWEALQGIPYGTTASYGELASRVGNPNASRAVGLANGRNPVAIIVPCHRVIGAGGSLTGYGGGLERKSWLLEHEADVSVSRSVGTAKN
jgi:methylated-DNA-[protein]-cysteine S-methyltransferase